LQVLAHIRSVVPCFSSFHAIAAGQNPASQVCGNLFPSPSRWIAPYILL
jgi:hypothetical protein